MIFKKTKPFNPEKIQGDVLGYTPQVIFDVGSFNGDGIVEYRKLYPLAKIYSVEPLKELNRELELRFSDDRNVHLFNCALAETTGMRSFYVNQSHDTSSLFRASTCVCEFVDPHILENIDVANVQIDTLDNLCSSQNIKRIDILKMDIQGGELLALKGAKSMLAKNNIALIYLEFIIAPIYVGQASFDDICSFLSGYGYALKGLYDLTISEDRSVKWGNAMFVSGATI